METSAFASSVPSSSLSCLMGSTPLPARAGPDLNRLSNRDKLVVEAEALTRLAETVTELERALAWTEARKLDAEVLRERYVVALANLLQGRRSFAGGELMLILAPRHSDRVYLNDAETMHAVFAERVEQAQAVEPLPPPDGREIVRCVAFWTWRAFPPPLFPMKGRELCRAGRKRC